MTATHPITADDLDAMEARANAATEGPWEVVPRTADEMIYEGDECRYCGEGTPLVGTEVYEGGHHGQLPYIMHRHLADAHHVVSGDNEITGNYEYSEGGILRGANTVFIAHARTEHPALIAEVRELRAQLRAAQDDAWKRGYDACKTGEQRHSPYRAVKAALVEAPALSPLKMSAKDARNWAYANLSLYSHEELANMSDEDLKLMIEANHAHG